MLICKDCRKALEKDDEYCPNCYSFDSVKLRNEKISVWLKALLWGIGGYVGFLILRYVYSFF